MSNIYFIETEAFRSFSKNKNSNNKQNLQLHINTHTHTAFRGSWLVTNNVMFEHETNWASQFVFLFPIFPFLFSSRMFHWQTSLKDLQKRKFVKTSILYKQIVSHLNMQRLFKCTTFTMFVNISLVVFFGLLEAANI